MRRDRSYLAFTLIGIASLYVLTIRSGHVWGDDFVQYLQHAANLAANDPYGKRLYIINPTLSIGPPAYPPVFPMMLVPMLKIFGLNFAAMKILMSLLFGVAFLSIALAFREALPAGQLVFFLLLLALSPTFWTFKEAIFSDVPFLIFSFASLALMQKMVSTSAGRNLYLVSLLTAVLIYLACGTRSQGLPLLPALLLADVWTAKRIRLAPLLTCGLVVLFLFIQNRVFHTEAERLQYLSLDPDLIWSNVSHYAGSLSTYWNNGYSRTVRYVCFVVALVLAVIGYARRLRRGLGPLEVYLPLFLLPLLFWVFQQGIRYLLPIIPIYLFYIWEGVQVIGSRAMPRTRKINSWLLAVVAFASFLSMYTTIDLRNIEGPLDPQAQEMFAYARTHSDPGDVFLFEKPRLMGLFSNRKAAIPTPVEDPKEDSNALEFYRSIQAKYLITTNSLAKDKEYLKPFLARHNDWAREVWSNGGFQMWKIQDDSTSSLRLDPEAKTYGRLDPRARASKDLVASQRKTVAQPGS